MKTLRCSLFSAQARWPYGDRTQRERKLVGDTTKYAMIRENTQFSLSSGANQSKWGTTLVPGTLNHRALDRVRFNLSSAFYFAQSVAFPLQLLLHKSQP